MNTKITQVIITGNTSQRRVLTAALADFTHPLPRTNVQWTSMRNYRLRSGFEPVRVNGVLVGATSKGIVVLESTLNGESGVRAARAAFDQLAGVSHVAPVTPGAPVVVYDPDAPLFYADETTNLFHFNHVGVEAAEFYPTKAEAIANGKVADGCVS